MSVIYTLQYKSPYGALLIGDYDGRICLADWQYRAKRKQIDERICSHLSAQYEEKETPLHKELVQQLKAYFEGRRKHFDLPLLFAGTDFQKSVWQQLVEIPYGKTCSYLDLSRRLGDEKAIRAVASANGANAISIIVPCHRVIGSKGELTGYAGGLQAKQQLLQLEGISQQQSLFV